MAGRVSQTMNNLRRDLMKTSLPKGYLKLASEAQESSELLFGESVCERLEKLNKENKLKEILNNKERKPKRMFDSSNENPSFKPLRRVEYRQGQRNYDDYRQNSHNYSQNRNNNNNKQYQSHQKKLFQKKGPQTVNYQKKNN